MAAAEPSTHTLGNGGGVFTVRSATPDDAPAMLDAAHDAFRSSPYLLTSPDEFTLTEQEERQFVAGILAHPRQLMLIADDGRRVLGMLDSASPPPAARPATACCWA
jgi:hypothetical protein